KAVSVEELRTIRQELTDSGFLRYRKNRNTKEKPSKPSPYAYTLTSGKRVFAGRNNKENDWLTLKKASSTDIWFHTKDIPGSHVILFTEGQEPSKEELFEAAAIAAWHSKGSSSENVPVDYTRVKYVKKPAGSKPGMVIFTHNKTLYVDPALPGPDHTAEK
ncbi:MAG: NFACT RNA binding domain-containing protein, partial [Clostridia bacterium]|nr:NFACT RNA binding domain-containing protein [Clostridia bacterium]